MFLLFGGDTYYPQGGWQDFIGDFISEESARKTASEKGYDWWHIVSGGEIIASGYG